MMDGPQGVATDTKEIRNGSMHCEKPLRVGSRFGPTHLMLRLPRVGWWARLFAYGSVQWPTDGITVRQAAG